MTLKAASIEVLLVDSQNTSTSLYLRLAFARRDLLLLRDLFSVVGLPVRLGVIACVCVVKFKTFVALILLNTHWAV